MRRFAIAITCSAIMVMGCGAFASRAEDARELDASTSPDADASKSEEAAVLDASIDAEAPASEGGALDASTEAAAVDGGPVGCQSNPACEHVVFVSSKTWNGALGGLSGADMKCQELADAVPALKNRIWKAWLSDGTASPFSRFVKATLPYKRVDGTTVAANWTALISGGLAQPISRDEKNASVTGDVWTSTSANSGLGNGQHCAGWLDATSSQQGRVGIAQSTGASWTESNTIGCAGPARLYCFEQ